MAISMVMWSDNWQPDSYYDKVFTNRKNGFHTLCLLGNDLYLVFIVLSLQLI